MRIVLSLFNGMGTLRQAMHNLNIPIEKYYSSEIKPYANKLQQHHFPDVIQVGDITKWREWDIDWSRVDFIGSGSPCQDLSAAGKRAGIHGSRSSLFFTFVEILNHVKKLNPNVLFLQENVGSAPKKDVGIMSRALGVYPCKINSSKLTTQNRNRYYWTNIKTRSDGMFGDLVVDIPQPKDLGIYLKDIIESGEVEKGKANAILERYGWATNCKNNNEPSGQRRLKKRSDKGFISIVKDDGYLRLFTQTELERLQGFPDGYTSILPYNQAASVLGDGWTLQVIEHILKYL